MASRYQHVTADVVTSIADQVGELYWSAEPDAERGQKGCG